MAKRQSCRVATEWLSGDAHAHVARSKRSAGALKFACEINCSFTFSFTDPRSLRASLAVPTHYTSSGTRAIYYHSDSYRLLVTLVSSRTHTLITSIDNYCPVSTNPPCPPSATPSTGATTKSARSSRTARGSGCSRSTRTTCCARATSTPSRTDSRAYGRRRRRGTGMSFMSG